VADVTTIDLLRHGKSEGGDIFRGVTDVPLSKEGWQQMLGASEGIEGWQKVVSSPMKRCQVFAGHISQQKGIDHIICDGLREVSFGDWDGKLFSEISDQHNEVFNAFWQDPINNTPPNAEPMIDFCERINKAFWSEVESAKGKHLLMVVHGGVIRAVLREVLQCDFVALMRYEVPYACISRIKIYHDEESGKHWPQLVFHNR